MSVTETVTCGGTLLRLIDTAGIHDTADAVEQLGVERSRRAAETADLVIAVVDGSQTPPTVDEDILALATVSSTVSRVVPGMSVTMARS